MAPAYRHNPTAAQNSAIADSALGTVQLRFINSAQQHFLLTVIRQMRPVSLTGLFRNFKRSSQRSQSEFPPVVDIALSDLCELRLEVPEKARKAHRGASVV